MYGQTWQPGNIMKSLQCYSLLIFDMTTLYYQHVSLIQFNSMYL